MVQLIQKFRSFTLWQQGLWAAAGLGLYFISSHYLDKSYAASRFPVPYFVQQTSFNAPQMKEWYAFMIQEGTLDVYLATQFIDFFFIATVIFAGFTIWTFFAGLHRKESFFRRWGYRLAWALPMAGAFDVLENLVSFFMIGQPDSFSDLWIYPYSGFAVLKFGCWAIALIWIMVLLGSQLILKGFWWLKA